IGEGGFGVVFLAEQEQPVARKVALKIVKLGMDTRQVVARFEQERQALALMEHPNIARVLDAGATDTGRPYFVMDLVKGEPITSYCDKNNLSIEERLELFAQVCHAVQHAHQKGIIHRDIKPSNVLVGTQDGKPQAKIIDFGIAKATSSKLTDKTLFTEHEQVIGTLQYMSPEQADGSLDIDTRADVYSLGVLLYELLAGSTPFDRKTLGAAMYGEVKRMIREVEPPRPSTRLSDSHELLERIAANRRVEPKRLGALVRGELDWIVMKALEKDRSRRYETANALAADVRRYLAGDAVVAAPPSAGYRVSKFVRRHRGVVVAGAAVAIALLVGAIGFAWQATVAQGERDLAVVARQAEAQERNKANLLAASESEQRTVAESNERRATAINQFLVTMLGSADIRELGREARVAQVLDRAAATVGAAFVDRPEVELTLRQILGATYLSLGMLDEAAPHIEAGLELNRQVHGETSAEFADSLRQLGLWKEQKGDVASARETFERAIAIAQQVSGAEDVTTLDLQILYANCLVKLGRQPEAEHLLREALAARTRTFGRDVGGTQIAINSLAVLLHRQERLDEAETLYREAAEIGERTLGLEHPDTLTARMNLASVLRSRGDVAAAEPLMAATYASTKKVFGELHPRTGAAALVLARLYTALGRYKDALPLHEESLALLRRAEGERTASVVKAKLELAMTLSQMGDTKRAVPILRDGAELSTALFGPQDRESLGARLDLANTLVKDGQKEEAETMFRDLLPAMRALGEDDVLAIITTNSYAVMLLGQERYAEAEPFERKALDDGRRVQGEDHKNTLITQVNLVSTLRELGQLDEAAVLGLDAVERFSLGLGPSHPSTAAARSV
ncbi:MAG: tetratricopeptide repeat protein, partial [Planctomycetota bacterium]